jgi:hypothetical protein
MTGPEHYRKAEQLLMAAGEVSAGDLDQRLAAAHVHATLALAAATWAGSQIAGGFGVDDDIARPWIEATS